MISLIKSTFHNEQDTAKKLSEFILNSNKLSFGDHCNAFEKKFSKWQGRKNTVFVNSGSSANLALIQSLLNLGRLKKGDKVGFSALTWSTNVMPLIQLGLEAVPVDVELDTLNVSSKQLENTLRKHCLKAMFITNLLGFSDDIDKISKACEREEIILLEDNCESLGTVYKNKKLGNYGLASTFSFYVGHHMSTIEGGAICTDDSELSDMLNVVRAHGWDRNMTENRQNKIRQLHNIDSEFYSRYTFYDLGYNLRPTEINGFIGVLQLDYLDEIIEKRQSNFTILSKIYDNENYYSMKLDHLDLISNFAVPIVCKSVELRNKLVEKCKGKIETRPIVGGDMTYQPFFNKYMPNYDKGPEKSNARLAHEQGLYFGNNPELTDEEINELLEIFI